MPGYTWYMNDGVDANGFQALTTTTVSAVNSAAGWVVGTGSTNHSELFANTERASSTFTGTTVPDGSIDTTNKDCFRSPIALTGSFASANWVFQFAVRSPTQGGAADGRIRFRIFKADANGSNATEITAAQQQGSLVSNVGSAADSNCTLTVNPGAFSVVNQYIFIQIAWERTGAGGMTTTNIRLRTGSASTPTGTVITTSNFEWAITGAVISETVLNAPSLALNIIGEVISATVLNAPTVSPGPVTLTSPSPIAATVLNAPTVEIPSTFPTTSILDDFNRSNADPLDGNWTTIPTRGLQEDFDLCVLLSSNTITDGAHVGGGSGISGIGAASYNTSFGADQEAYVDIITRTGNSVVDLWVRVLNEGTSSVTGYSIVCRPDATFDDIKVVRWDDSLTAVQLGATISIPGGSADGDKLGISVVGDQIKVWYKSGAGSWTSLGTRTDSTYSTGGKIGLRVTLTTLDNFGGGSIGALDITTPSPISATVLNAPALVQNITGATISSTVLNAPTVSPGPVTITSPSPISATVLNAPEIAQNLTTPSPISATVLNSPTLSPGPVTIVGEVISATVLNAPTLTPGAVDLTSPSPISETVLNAPTLTPGPVTIVGVVISGTVLNAPTLAPGPVDLTTPSPISETALNAPTLTPGPVTIVGEVISGTVLNAPIVVAEGGDQFILGTVISATVLNAPTLTPGPVTIVGAAISATVLNAPSVDPGAVTITGQVISATVLNVPSLAVGDVTIVGNVISGTVLNAPTVTPGPVTIIGVLISETVLNAPMIAYDGITGPSAISSTIIFSPSVSLESLAEALTGSNRGLNLTFGTRVIIISTPSRNIDL